MGLLISIILGSLLLWAVFDVVMIFVYRAERRQRERAYGNDRDRGGPDFSQRPDRR